MSIKYNNYPQYDLDDLVKFDDDENDYEEEDDEENENDYEEEDVNENDYDDENDDEENEEEDDDELDDLIAFDDEKNDDNGKIINHMKERDVSFDFIKSFFENGNKIKKIYILYYIYNKYEIDGNILFYLIDNSGIDLQCTDKDSFDAMIIIRLLKIIIYYKKIFKFILLRGINLRLVNNNNNINVLYECLKHKNDASVIQLIFYNGYVITYKEEDDDENKIIIKDMETFDILYANNFDFTKTTFLHSNLWDKYYLKKKNVNIKIVDDVIIKLLEYGVNQNKTNEYLNYMLHVCFYWQYIDKELITAFLSVLDYDIGFILKEIKSNGFLYKEMSDAVSHMQRLIILGCQDTYGKISEREKQFNVFKNSITNFILTFEKTGYYVLK